ncbi:MAG: phosphotransferase [Armatimonadetes bacterium]|nr:phosphotransferase [Armatimonadota bacterium]
MKAVIVAAGEGTRLRPLTYSAPKPLITVAGIPLLEWNLDLLSRHGITEVVITVSYLGQKIMERYKEGRYRNLPVRFSVEPIPIGTAGGVKQAARRWKKPFLVLPGDNLTDLDLTRFLSYHKRKKGLATLATYKVRGSDSYESFYGAVLTDLSGKIIRFVPDTDYRKTPNAWIDTGIYLLEPEILGMIPEGAYGFKENLFQDLLDRGETLFAYRMADSWRDTGTLHRYLQAQMEKNASQPHIGPSCTVARTSKVSASVLLGENRIGPGAVVRSCILGEEVGILPHQEVSDVAIACGEWRCIADSDEVKHYPPTLAQVERFVRERLAPEEQSFFLTPLKGGFESMVFLFRSEEHPGLIIKVKLDPSERALWTEHHALRVAGGARLAPEPVLLDLTLQWIRFPVLVTRFLEGDEVSRSATVPASWKALGRLLAKVHAIGEDAVRAVQPAFPRYGFPALEDFFQDTLRVLDRYFAFRQKYDLPDEPFLEALVGLLEGLHPDVNRTRSLWKKPVAQCLCHGDFRFHNILKGKRLHLIDWEWAGIGDPAYETAWAFVLNDLSQGEETMLLRAYKDALEVDPFFDERVRAYLPVVTTAWPIHLLHYLSHYWEGKYRSNASLDDLKTAYQDEFHKRLTVALNRRKVAEPERGAFSRIRGDMLLVPDFTLSPGSSRHNSLPFEGGTAPDA